jgi:hypothetical protein
VSTLWHVARWLYTARNWLTGVLDTSRQRATETRQLGRMERGEIDG